MKVLDVFSCIGMHSIGLQRSGGFDIVAMCESNPRRRQELKRLHPEISIYDDIRTMPITRADIIFGGPPCQKTSVAAAISGKRTGESLWPYMLAQGLNSGCKWFIVEQPPGNAEWERTVFDGLSEQGYHCGRFEFGACDIGAPYLRRRVYIIACTDMPRLALAWSAIPSAIECVKRAALNRGDWHPDSIPAFDMDAWRSEDVHERREIIEACGDSNPPHMAEIIGHMLLAASNQIEVQEGK